MRRGLRYSTGEMAQLFGMTKEGIRFMEKKGVIVASEIDENGYHYFDQDQVTQLKRVRSYRALGFSLEEALRMLNSAQRNTLIPDIEGKLCELEKKEQEIREMKIMLKRQHEAAKRAIEQEAEFEIRESPALIFMSRPRTVSAQWRDKPSLNGPWIRAMPYVSMTIYIDKQGSERRGSSVTAADAQRLELPLDEEMVHLAPQRCLHGVIESPTFEKPDMQPVFAWAKAHGLTLSGEMICLLQVTYFTEEGEKWSIHEVFAPISEDVK